MNDANGHLPHLVALKNLKCMLCGRITEAASTGIDLFIDGDKVPGEPTMVKFPSRVCGHQIKWRRSTDRNNLLSERN